MHYSIFFYKLCFFGHTDLLKQLNGCIVPISSKLIGACLFLTSLTEHIDTMIWMLSNIHQLDKKYKIGALKYARNSTLSAMISHKAMLLTDLFEVIEDVCRHADSKAVDAIIERWPNMEQDHIAELWYGICLNGDNKCMQVMLNKLGSIQLNHLVQSWHWIKLHADQNTMTAIERKWPGSLAEIALKFIKFSRNGTVSDSSRMDDRYDILTFFVNSQKILAEYSFNERKLRKEGVSSFCHVTSKVEQANPLPETTLLQFLRRTLLLTGCKEACGQGGCGACTVMLSKYDWINKKIVHITANSCLIPICYLHGMAVTTVEGIGSTRNGLHPIQKQLVASHGIQCGFCTPGMVMTMYTLLRNNPNPSQELIERSLEGNLCRCTGYRPIVDAFKKCACGLGLCGNSNLAEGTNKQEQTISANGNKNDLTQDPIFPSELQLDSTYQLTTVKFKGNDITWIRPSSLEELCKLKSKFPKAPVVMGCTSIGYLLRQRKLDSDVIICGTNVPDLNEIKSTENELIVGSSVTLTQLEDKTRSLMLSLSDLKKKMLMSLLECLRWLAADQVRNVATVGGHIMSHAPNLDLQVFLLSAGATLQFVSKGIDRETIKYENSFFTEGGVVDSSILVAVSIPYLGKAEYIKFQKQPERRGFDYAILNSCMYVQFENGTDVIENLRLCYGGVGSKPKILESIAKYSKGLKWKEEDRCKINERLIEEMKMIDSKDIKYKTAVASGFLYKFFLEIETTLKIGQKEQSLLDDLNIAFPPSNSSQIYEVPDGKPNQAVWKPLPHYAGESIVTGEACFVDDIPSYKNELFLAYVKSRKAHAKILSVDPTEALRQPDVVDYIDHNDVPGENNFGFSVKDDILFAVDKVTCYDQVIGAIVASTRETARRAAKLVKVEYEEMEAIYNNQEAIAKKSFHDFNNTISKGDTESGLKNAPFTLEGEFEIGSQEHMYMETQSVIVVPKENKEIEVFASIQSLMDAQSFVSVFLGVPNNKVTVRTKRVGGGFGGKASDTLNVIGHAAVAAFKTQRPVRNCLDRETDMRVTGKRHPFFVKYKVGFSGNGKITAVDLTIYSNAGHTMGVSAFAFEVCLMYTSGAYNIENFKATGYITKTNIPSSTSVRSIAIVQATFIIENIINEIAVYLGIDKTQVCEQNMYRNGDTTLGNKVLTDFTLPRCWKECLEDSNYLGRKRHIKEFNSCNRYKKKGIAIMPLIFPLGYPPLSMNQATALLHVYLDGTVLFTHGGVELGQGINTKMIQVAGTALGIPTEKIYINETSTSTLPNTTATGGSATNGLNAGAVLNACEIFNDRLRPYKEANKSGKWEDWIQAAYNDRVCLSVTGFYKQRDTGYDFKDHSGIPCAYFTYGAACSEVEIDCLTGEHQLVRTDIVMDIGKSLNPAVDIGQIEGGFVMGCGFMTTEQLYLDEDGRIHNSGPINYKVPTVRNIPREFNVKLLKECENKVAVYSAKGTGEPPLVLAITVHHAIKDAILSVRRDYGLDGNFRLDSPATAKVIRLSCGDDILQKCSASVTPDVSKYKTL